MKKKLIISFFILLTVNLFSQQYDYDTLSNVQVGMGIYHLHIAENSMPWNINVIEVDLSSSYNFFETVKSNDRLSAGLEKTSSMAERKNYAGHTVVAAINGDFYSGSNPTNIQILKGEILTNPINREAIGFDLNNKPIIEIFNYSGKVIIDTNVNPINGTNKTRGTDQLILYNYYFGSSTNTNIYGTEISVQPIDTWYVNDTVRTIVTNKVIGQGNMVIPQGQVVLSGHGTSKAFLDNFVQIGDTIKILNTLIPGIPKIKEMVGGSERIIQNGINLNRWPERHPRTAVGFNQDTSKIYLVTVDGRQSISAGMTLGELGDFFLQIGTTDAINLDGGGSTTMIVRGEIVNSPSDGGGERTVANALLLVTSTPQGSLNQIKMTPEFIKLYHNQTTQFKVRGWDEYFNPVVLDTSKLQFSLSSNFGIITKSGLFTAGNEPDTGYVFVEYEGYKDTSLVIVKGIEKIILTPKNAITDTMRVIQFRTAAFDMDNTYHSIPNNEYEWTSTDENVGIVDTSGNFYGKSEGTTNVIATYRSVSDTAEITVEINEGFVVLDSLENLNNWIFESENIDINNSSISISPDTFSFGYGSFKINYQFTYDPTKLYWIYLKTDIPIDGVPEFVWLDAKSDGQQHFISYYISDDNDELFSINTNKYADQTQFFDTLRASFEHPVQVGGSYFFNFPIKLKQINIRLGSARQQGQTYSGTIYLDNLRISYPENITGVEDEIDKFRPDKFILFQNYPNPFNPTTKIKYTIPASPKSSPKERTFVRVVVYDILGNEITTLVNEEKPAGTYEIEFSGKGLSSGIYFYKLTAGNFVQVKKMIMLK